MEQIVFAHLSDLHCRRRVTNEAVGLSMLYAQWVAIAFDDARAVTELADAEPLRAVVTGDSSDSGLVGELALAHTWLQSQLRLRRHGSFVTAGLTLADDRLLTIPGNHDHWRGHQWVRCPAFSPAAVAEHFAATPWHASWQTGSLRVSFFGVDSASGMAAVGSTNRYASGRISNEEFDRLEMLLMADRQGGETGVVRCILCHHSPAHRDPWGGHFNELASDSRQRLEALGRRFGVCAILTGHTHDFFHPADRTTFPVELRSSALAGDPTDLLADVDRRPGFWVHAVRREGGRVSWLAWRYGWNGSKFARVAREPCLRLFPG